MKYTPKEDILKPEIQILKKKFRQKKRTAIFQLFQSHCHND